jgi:hypothetical protein
MNDLQQQLADCYLAKYAGYSGGNELQLLVEKLDTIFGRLHLYGDTLVVCSASHCEWSED